MRAVCKIFFTILRLSYTLFGIGCGRIMAFDGTEDFSCKSGCNSCSGFTI